MKKKKLLSVLCAMSMMTSPQIMTAYAVGNVSEPSAMTVSVSNPDCEIEDSAETICNTYDEDTKEAGVSGVIRGYTNSTAQKYAEKYGYKFEAIDGGVSAATSAAAAPVEQTTTTASKMVETLDIKFGTLQGIEFLPREEDGEMLYLRFNGIASVIGPKVIDHTEDADLYNNVKKNILDSIYEAIPNVKGSSNDIQKLMYILRDEAIRIYKENGYYDKTGYMLNTLAFATFIIAPATTTPGTTATTVLPTTVPTATTTTTATTTAPKPRISIMVTPSEPSMGNNVMLAGNYGIYFHNCTLKDVEYKYTFDDPDVKIIENSPVYKDNVIKPYVSVERNGADFRNYTLVITKATDINGNDMLPYFTKTEIVVKNGNEVKDTTTNTGTAVTTAATVATTNAAGSGTTATAKPAVQSTATSAAASTTSAPKSTTTASTSAEQATTTTTAPVPSVEIVPSTYGPKQRPEPNVMVIGSCDISFRNCTPKDVEYKVIFDDPNVKIVEYAPYSSAYNNSSVKLCTVVERNGADFSNYTIVITKVTDTNGNDLLPYLNQSELVIKDNNLITDTATTGTVTTSVTTATTTAATTSTTTTTPVSGTNELGDVDGSGFIDARDSSAVLTAYARASSSADEKTGLTPAQEKAADVTEDNIIDGRDASAILTFYAMTSAGKNVSISDFSVKKK